MINRSHVFSLFLVLLLVFLQYRLWFETGGVLDMIRLKKEVALQNKKNDVLKRRNEIVLLQVQHLQKDKNAIESRARHELGMIKKGETFYQVVN